MRQSQKFFTFANNEKCLLTVPHVLKFKQAIILNSKQLDFTVILIFVLFMAFKLNANSATLCFCYLVGVTTMTLCLR